MIQHTIQPGQTSASIARQYGISQQALFDANPKLVKARGRYGIDFAPEHFRLGGVLLVPAVSPVLLQTTINWDTPATSAMASVPTVLGSSTPKTVWDRAFLYAWDKRHPTSPFPFNYNSVGGWLAKRWRTPLDMLKAVARGNYDGLTREQVTRMIYGVYDQFLTQQTAEALVIAFETNGPFGM